MSEPAPHALRVMPVLILHQLLLGGLALSAGGQIWGGLGLLLLFAALVEGLLVLRELYRRWHTDRPVAAVPDEILLARMEQLKSVQKRSWTGAPTVSRLPAQAQPFPGVSLVILQNTYWQYGCCHVLMLEHNGEALLFLPFAQPRNPLFHEQQAGDTQEISSLIGHIWPSPDTMDEAATQQWLHAASEVLQHKQPAATLQRLSGARCRDLGPHLHPHIQQSLQDGTPRVREMIRWLDVLLNFQWTPSIPIIHETLATLPPEILAQMQEAGLDVDSHPSGVGIAYTHSTEAVAGEYGGRLDVVSQVRLTSTPEGWTCRREVLWVHRKHGQALS